MNIGNIIIARTARDLALAGIPPLAAILAADLIALHGWRTWTVTADGVRIDDADMWIVDDGGGADVYRGETTASAVAEAWVASGHRAVAVLGRPLLRVSGCVEVEVASC